MPQQVDVSNYPANLKVLVPFLAQWGVSDDDLRGDQIRSAPDPALGRLAEATLPRLQEIDAYLASVPRSQAEAASLLDHLAQAALEASDELRNRRMRRASE